MKPRSLRTNLGLFPKLHSDLLCCETSWIFHYFPQEGFLSSHTTFMEIYPPKIMKILFFAISSFFFSTLPSSPFLPIIHSSLIVNKTISHPATFSYDPQMLSEYPLPQNTPSIKFPNDLAP